MQIHELPTFAGDLENGSYAVFDDGTQTGKATVDDLLAPLNTRIDNIITSPAPTQQEIIDARIGADGKTYSTLAKAIQGQMNEVFSILKNNAYDVLPAINTYTNKTTQGVTYTWSGNKCLISGTASAQNFNNIWYKANQLPDKVVPGSYMWLLIDSSDSKIYTEIFWYKGGNFYSSIARTGSDMIKVPDDAEGMLIRNRVSAGVTVNGAVEVKLMTTLPLSEYIITKNPDAYLNEGQYVLSDIKEDGYYLPNTSYPTADAPAGFSEKGYFLKVENFGWSSRKARFSMQTAIGQSADILGHIYYRVSNVAGTYSPWFESSGGSGGGNQYTFNEYSNTYNVTATPTIRTDTNSYLAPTGDSTNVTNSIISLLTSTGVCRLGKGTYYVKNLVMPENTSIIGAGTGTIIRLIDGDSDCFAIRPTSQCIVKDLAIIGSSSAVTIQESIRKRDGIRWYGTYSHDQQAPDRCILENLYVSKFTGSGIRLYDTGYATTTVLHGSNLFIYNCDAGLNLEYWTEFNKFLNVRANNCYFGCINNGGNNIFTNCDFSSNKVGMLMDNSQGQSPNNSHGSCVGCVFNHTDSNAGIGIKILNCANGFIFTGCQIFFSQIYIENSVGIIISDTNFGYSNCNITVNGGKLVLFANNGMQGKPPISITGNNSVHFVNCYNRNTGAIITA